MQHMKLHAGKALFLSLLALFLSAVVPRVHAHADGRINIRAVHLEYHACGLTA